MALNDSDSLFQKKKVLQGEALSLLRSDHTVFDKALVLCQMHNFKEGVLYLYEKGKLWVTFPFTLQLWITVYLYY